MDRVSPVHKLPREEAIRQYGLFLAKARKEGEPVLRDMMRFMCQNDLFFLLTRVLKRKDANKDFIYDRCRMVQESPNGYLDLWAREHYKSTIITFALTIQDILNNPDATFGIFSHTRPIAKAFLRQIKREFEENEVLKDLFADILFEKPAQQSPKWSEDEGIIVRRKSNPKEATIEAWGLVDGQPTSKHYSHMVYDDVVTKESVQSPTMIINTTTAWENSRNLASMDGGVTRYIGTRWHYADTYSEILKRKVATPRIYTEEDRFGELHLWTPELRDMKRREMGPYVYACQIRQDPKQGSQMGFSGEWVRYWKGDNYRGMNIALICDPASSKKKKDNDYTVMLVAGRGSDGKRYLIDGLRDRLNLTEKWRRYVDFHRKYRPVISAYEEYGLQADIEYFEEKMEQENYRFRIVPVGGSMPKADRIQRLVPWFENGDFYLPERIMKRNWEGEMYNLVKVLVEEELLAFPFCEHDDTIDCLSRLCDNEVQLPIPEQFAEGVEVGMPMGLIPRDAESGYDVLRYGLE